MKGWSDSVVVVSVRCTVTPVFDSVAARQSRSEPALCCVGSGIIYARMYLRGLAYA